MKYEITEENPEFDDDVLLEKTPDAVIAILGFDPLDLEDDEEEEEASDPESDSERSKA